jgi:hypothetical protein
MRAELVVLGKPVDLSLRARRRMLVTGIYATLLILIAAVAWSSHYTASWQLGGVYLVFFTLLLNRVLLGGYARGGLIRNFNNREPYTRPTPPLYLLLSLHLRLSSASDMDWRNDERELHLRDRAHYLAYQVIACLMAVVWLSTGWSAATAHLLAWLHISTTGVLYLLALATVLLAITLPQSILLWNEPDMIELPPDE